MDYLAHNSDLDVLPGPTSEDEGDYDVSDNVGSNNINHYFY